jgi:HSP20 family molecular chaperone IbpA
VFENFRTGLENFFWTPRFAPVTGLAAVGTRAALVDVRGTGKELVVTAELPGVHKEDLDIGLNEDGVEIKAQRRGAGCASR